MRNHFLRWGLKVDWIDMTDLELKLKFREVRYKIITPHPGEAARILGVTVNEVQEDRFAENLPLHPALQFRSLFLAS